MSARANGGWSELKLGMRQSGSEAGPDTLTSIRHSPVISRQVCSDVAGPKPSQEVGLWFHDLDKGTDLQGLWPGTGTAVTEQEL